RRCGGLPLHALQHEDADAFLPEAPGAIAHRRHGAEPEGVAFELVNILPGLPRGGAGRGPPVEGGRLPHWVEGIGPRPAAARPSRPVGTPPECEAEALIECACRGAVDFQGDELPRPFEAAAFRGTVVLLGCIGAE